MIPSARKALSWALRSIIPWDPAATDSFLSEHEAVLPALVLPALVLPALVKREVRTRLRTGTKSGRSKAAAGEAPASPVHS